MITTLDGIAVVVHEPLPRYRLPPQLVLPGCGITLEWPPGFRDAMDAWTPSLGELPPVIPDGQAIMAAGRLHLNRRTFDRVAAAAQWPDKGPGGPLAALSLFG